jgi:hypothetical protein
LKQARNSAARFVRVLITITVREIQGCRMKLKRSFISERHRECGFTHIFGHINHQFGFCSTEY